MFQLYLRNEDLNELLYNRNINNTASDLFLFKQIELDLPLFNSIHTMQL